MNLYRQSLALILHPISRVKSIYANSSKSIMKTVYFDESTVLYHLLIDSAVEKYGIF